MASEIAHEKIGDILNVDAAHEEHAKPDQQKLDKAGLPLSPQPTDRKDDPLVCRCAPRMPVREFIANVTII